MCIISEVVDDTEDTWIEFYDPARERIYYVKLVELYFSRDSVS